MAQKQKAPRQAKDPYAQRSKELGSAVQRLRGWVGSDPSRLPELGDALVALTGHRLRGHEYAAAGADAQDSVKQAAQLLTAGGAVGAYTEAVDAGRYVTAVVQLASVQSGLGLAEAAGRTVASLDDLHEQFLALRLDLPLEPEVVVRALLCTAGAALAGGDVATAGSSADEALRRLVAAGLDTDPDAAYLALDVDRLVADTRWAANRPSESLALLHRARDRWAAVVDGRLDAPAGLSPSLVARLAAPAPLLHRDLADRLVATQEVDLGLVTRRALVDLLRRLEGRTGTPTQRPLATALADLAADLLASDRVDEAEESSAAALAALGTRGEVSWPVVVRAQVLGRTGRPAEAVSLLRERPLPEAAAALTGLVLHTLAQCQRASGETQAAEESEQDRDRVVRQLGLQHLDQLVDHTRGVLSRGSAPVSWPSSRAHGLGPADGRGGRRRTPPPRSLRSPAPTTGWVRSAARPTGPRSGAPPTLGRKPRAGRRRSVSEPQPPPRRPNGRRHDSSPSSRPRSRVGPPPKRRNGRRPSGAARSGWRPTGWRRSAEPPRSGPGEVSPEEVSPEEVGPEPVSGGPDPLDLARQAWQQARAAGDRRTARDAADRLVEVLRPRVEADPGQHGPLLQQVLSELAGLRMRGGDLRGARAASREARELGRRIGR